MKTIKLSLLLISSLLTIGPLVSAQTLKRDLKASKKKPLTELADAKQINKSTPSEQKALKTEVTEECQVNLSLFTESAKVKNYADALDPWQKVYNDCPAASKNIYILGVRILEWKMQQAATDTEKEQVFNQLMELYDTQILYFGNDPKSPKADILGKKATSYAKYRPNDWAAIYPWLKESVTTLQANSDANVIYLMIQASDALYKADNSLAEQYINDYTLANTLAEQNSQNAALKNAAAYGQVKEQASLLFAVSGVADCDKMNEIFLPNVEKNKTNGDYLASIITLFKRLKCNKTEAYFAASTYTHAIAPSSESAAGLGNMCLSKKDYAQAITYYEEAVRLGGNDDDIAENLFNIAFAYYQTKQNVKAREYCKQSLAKKSDQAQPYLILGLLYANAGNINDDPILNLAKYWAAVDQFQKAKNFAQGDQNIIDQASQYIRIYSAHYPGKEEIFMHPDLEEGKSYFVGSWINENTTVRSK